MRVNKTLWWIFDFHLFCSLWEGMLREEGRKKVEKKTLTTMTHVKVIDPLRPTFERGGP